METMSANSLTAKIDEKLAKMNMVRTDGPGWFVTVIVNDQVHKVWASDK